MVLDEDQEKQILNYIKKYDSRKIENEICHLILSFLSIDDADKKYVVLYYNVRFNPSNRNLSIDDIPRINQSFLIENKKHSITSYIDIEPQEFVYNITNY